jgi:hypothetical protein
MAPLLGIFVPMTKYLQRGDFIEKRALLSSQFWRFKGRVWLLPDSDEGLVL